MKFHLKGFLSKHPGILFAAVWLVSLIVILGIWYLFVFSGMSQTADFVYNAF